MHFISKIRHFFERQEERYPTFEAVEIMSEEGSLIGTATLRDISKSGALMQINVILSFPERIMMRIPRLNRTVEASIVWSNSGEMGIRFDRDVDLAMFAMKLEQREELVGKYFKRMRAAA